jgi:hypothetical protein
MYRGKLRRHGYVSDVFKNDSDVYVRYLFKSDTNGGQDVSSVLSILAVNSFFW